MVLGKEKRIKLLGVPLDNLPQEDFDAVLLNLVQSINVRRAVFLDFSSFLREKRRLKKGTSILDGADLVLTTSKALAVAANYIYGTGSVRFYPFSFIVNLLGLLEKRNCSVYFLGGSSKDIMRLFSNIRSSFPSLKIVGRYKGSFHSSEEAAVLTGIKKAGPNFLLAGSSIRKGDRWLTKNSNALSHGLMLWSPDAFEVMAGNKKAMAESKWLKKSGVNWKTFCLPWKWLKLFGYLLFWIQVAAEKRAVSKSA